MLLQRFLNVRLTVKKREVIESKVNAEVAPVDENLHKPFEKMKLAEENLSKIIIWKTKILKKKLRLD